MSRQKLKPIPKFKSEAEERAFWEDESNDTTEYFDWSKAKRVTFPNLQLSTKTISIRLPQGLLDDIRIHANKLDVPYQSLMKVWLAEKAHDAALQALKRQAARKRGGRSAAA